MTDYIELLLDGFPEAEEDVELDIRHSALGAGSTGAVWTGEQSGAIQAEGGGINSQNSLEVSLTEGERVPSVVDKLSQLRGSAGSEGIDGGQWRTGMTQDSQLGTGGAEWLRGEGHASASLSALPSLEDLSRSVDWMEELSADVLHLGVDTGSGGGKALSWVGELAQRRRGVSQSASSSLAVTGQPFSAEVTQGGGSFDVNQLDRLFQRDARRYDGGFSLY